jgi:hypothetical protein
MAFGQVPHNMLPVAFLTALDAKEDKACLKGPTFEPYRGHLNRGGSCFYS